MFAAARWGSRTHGIANSPLPKDRDTARLSKRCDSSKKNVLASKSWLIRLAGVTGPLPAPDLSPLAHHRARLEVVPAARGCPWESG